MQTIQTTSGKAIPTAKPKAPTAPKAAKASIPLVDRKSLLSSLREHKAKNGFGAPLNLLGFKVFYGRRPRNGHKGQWDHVFTLVRGNTKKLIAECVTLPAESAADFLFESQPGAADAEPSKKPVKKAA